MKVPCVPAAAESEPSTQSVQTEPAAPPGKRILVVDDNRDAADSLGLLLGLDGHDVRVAYAGRQALEIVKDLRSSPR